ncbi:hypothetical protein E2C01_068921 [Portunus trituberculatus]|uniref:Uncharacterized protein n=1 Tax=Portunus trituberculatus TaxID=210409 RepID=A0A5B7I0U1_PORTR|nr:hypothetical protein [Portunus trituberculatus]
MLKTATAQEANKHSSSKCVVFSVVLLVIMKVKTRTSAASHCHTAAAAAVAVAVAAAAAAAAAVVTTTGGDAAEWCCSSTQQLHLHIHSIVLLYIGCCLLFTCGVERGLSCSSFLCLSLSFFLLPSFILSFSSYSCLSPFLLFLSFLLSFPLSSLSYFLVYMLLPHSFF